jgi:hypothetical protein
VGGSIYVDKKGVGDNKKIRFWSLLMEKKKSREL